MYLYSAIGLDVQSDVELAALPGPPLRSTTHPTRRPCVIERLDSSEHPIDWCGLSNLDLALETPSIAWSPASGIFETPEGWLYRAFYEGTFVEVFVERDGSRVTWARTAEITEHDLASLLSGAMLSAAAAARGALVLHGSVLEVGQRHVALLGTTGTGKSTTTALFLEHGARLVSEDAFGVERLSTGPGLEFGVLPGSRWLRLGDPAILAINREPMDWPLVHLASDKRLLVPDDTKIASDEYRTPRLDALYFLTRGRSGESVGIAPLKPARALSSLQAMMPPLGCIGARHARASSGRQHS